MTPSEHPARSVDVIRAASTLTASLDGSGPFWDPLALELRPDLHVDVVADADTLAEIRKRLRDSCRGRESGSRLRNRTAGMDIPRWCTMRAEEKRTELLDIALDGEGMMRVQRVVAARPAGLRSALGVFWSSDLGHGGILSAPWKTNGDPEIVLTARVHHSHIDWQTTCVARMDIHSGDYEKEIRLHPGRPLLDVGAGTWDQSLIPERSMPLELPAHDWTT